MDQAIQPGLSMLTRYRRTACAVFVALACVFGLGSAFVHGHSLAGLPAAQGDLDDMGQRDLMRYAYALQDKTFENPQNLYQLSGRDVSLMLAKPDLERHDYPSVVWQYRTQSCVLDVYYTEGQGSDLAQTQVQHFEIRPRGLITEKRGQKADPKNCLSALFEDRQEVIEAGFRQVYADASVQ